jgi:hypothetical protein
MVFEIIGINSFFILIFFKEWDLVILKCWNHLKTEIGGFS